MFPSTRLRRLRQTPALRALTREQTLTVDDLILPLFVDEALDKPLAIDSMPGVRRESEASLPDAICEAAELGIKGVLLFGVSSHKDAVGSDSMRDEGLLGRMVRIAKAAAPNIAVIPDICFCEFTDHGHCGVVVDGDVDNDATLENIVAQSLVAARAGADIVAPSGMMDGFVTAVRNGLDEAGYPMLPIMAYSSKFASSFYGPFRDAAGCELDGDRKTYQMPPSNGREAIRESLQDELEGADILMVKPGMPYLDVIARLRETTLLPLCAYQISGEYAMIRFAAQAGAIDEDPAILESLTGFKRAGADMIITYFARRAAGLLKG